MIFFTILICNTRFLIRQSNNEVTGSSLVVLRDSLYVMLLCLCPFSSSNRPQSSAMMQCDGVCSYHYLVQHGLDFTSTLTAKGENRYTQAHALCILRGVQRDVERSGRPTSVKQPQSSASFGYNNTCNRDHYSSFEFR